jgi:hypothetical protein
MAVLDVLVSRLDHVIRLRGGRIAMTALAIILASALLTASGGLIGLALVSRKDNREALAVRDLLDAQRQLARQYEMERDVEIAAHAVTSTELREARERLSIAEAQRNTAYREARDHYVEQVKNAPIADAGKLLEELLAAPWPSAVGMPKARTTDDTSADDSDLEKP